MPTSVLVACTVRSQAAHISRESTAQAVEFVEGGADLVSVFAGVVSEVPVEVPGFAPSDDGVAAVEAAAAESRESVR